MPQVILRWIFIHFVFVGMGYFFSRVYGDLCRVCGNWFSYLTNWKLGIELRFPDLVLSVLTYWIILPADFLNHPIYLQVLPRKSHEWWYHSCLNFISQSQYNVMSRKCETVYGLLRFHLSLSIAHKFSWNSLSNQYSYKTGTETWK